MLLESSPEEHAKDCGTDVGHAGYVAVLGNQSVKIEPEVLVL